MKRGYTDWSQLPLILTSREIQFVLGISRATAEKLFKTGQLKARKVGEHWRVAKTDLIAFCEGGESA